MDSPPVLFLIFNRPDVTEKALSTIRNAQPQQLFVAGDGPRPNRSGEKDACEQARRVATEVDWDCDVKTLFRDENLGCERAVSSAITWFFEHVEQGIILEDDCVADPTFFEFCSEMLNQYAGDDRVGAITGDNFQRGRQRGESSYYFSKYPHCWGWATWKRCWKYYESNLYRSERELLDTIGTYSNIIGESGYWQRIFQKTQSREIDSWAYRWTFITWKHRYLTVTPQHNLVENIGFGSDATHTTAQGAGGPKVRALEFPLVKTDTVQQNKKADAFVARKTFRVGYFALLKQMFRALSSIIFVRKA